MKGATYPLTLYYESACALCNGEMTNLMLRNTAGKLRFVDVSAPGFDSPPPGTKLEDLLELIHAQRADGSVVRGVEVFRLAYRAVGLDWVVAPTDWPLLGRLADRLYPWIARNRHHIPRVLSHVLFETAVRRAAERSAANRCDADEACTRSTS
jgi:predicted DCC family thiol-disulfide oxidoreductase YuxK